MALPEPWPFADAEEDDVDEEDAEEEDTEDVAEIVEDGVDDEVVATAIDAVIWLAAGTPFSGFPKIVPLIPGRNGCPSLPSTW